MNQVLRSCLISLLASFIDLYYFGKANVDAFPCFLYFWLLLWPLLVCTDL